MDVTERMVRLRDRFRDGRPKAEEARHEAGMAIEDLPGERLVAELGLTRTEQEMLADISDAASFSDYIGFGFARTGRDLASVLREMADFCSWGWTQNSSEVEVAALAAKLMSLDHREALCLLSRFGWGGGAAVRQDSSTAAIEPAEESVSLAGDDSEE